MYIEGIMDQFSIAVLAGGFSAEKEVSERSGANILASLKEAGIAAQIFNPADKDFSFAMLKNFDVVYSVLHGTFGEDGALQGILEYYKIPYAGCGPSASALTMDKLLTEKLFHSMGLPCPMGFEALNAEDALNKINSYPSIVKPVCNGSSVGVLILHNQEEAKKLLPAHLKKFPRCLIEPLIKGREMTTGLSLYKGELIFLPILELAPKTEFYDYNAKYTAGMTNFIIPASPMDETVRARIENDCKNIYQAFSLEGSIRVDLILASDNTPYYLEINTSPGMTATSDIPAMLQCAGIKVSDYIVDLCLQALKKRKS